MPRGRDVAASDYRPPSEAAERWFARWSVYGTALGTALAIAIALGDGTVRRVDLALFATLSVLTGIGVSAGLHRLFSHRSFETVRGLRWFLGLAGAATGQGYVLRWIFDHRIHHQHTDAPGDPHSPHVAPGSPGARGLWHAHAGWLFQPRCTIDPRRLRDHLEDPVVRWVDRHGPAITTLGLLLPGVIAWAVHPEPGSALRGALWGGCVRMFVINHMTWSVNSIGHCWGTRLPGQKGAARNSLVMGILAFGDGWHANHHAHPRSARHGWGWRQPDLNWWWISAARHLGWVTKVIVTPPTVDHKGQALH
jgi:stearoyl-CoA desaturase (delta-9 desaturase)